MAAVFARRYGPPLRGFETREEDGSWRPVTVYACDGNAHRRKYGDHGRYPRTNVEGNVVLWYGEDEYTGIRRLVTKVDDFGGATVRWLPALTLRGC